MKRQLTSPQRNWSAYVLGTSLALYPIERVGWIAVISMTVMIVVSIVVVLYNTDKLKSLNKWVFVPLGLLTVLCIVNGTEYGRFYVIGLSCLAVSVVILGKDVLKPLGIGVIVGSISVVAIAIGSGFLRTGGMYHVSNYNLAFGTLVFGALLWRFKYQWIVVSIAVIGSLFTGADEFLVVLVIVGIVALARRDFSKKLLLIVSVGSICGILLVTPAGRLWTSAVATVLGSGDQKTQTWVEKNWNYRLEGIDNALQNLTINDTGNAENNTKQTTAHNTELRVLYDLGPLGLALWLWLVLYGLIKTSWKYLFVGILAMSVFDHFVWTQLSPYFFVAVGVCTTMNEQRDLMFR